MEPGDYRIVLSGRLLHGCDLNQAVTGLSNLFDRPPEHIRGLFRDRPVALNKTLSFSAARHLRERILATGADCALVPTTQSGAKLDLIPPKQATAPSAQPLTCPKCGHSQPPSPTCRQCGAMFARRRQGAPAKPRAALDVTTMAKYAAVIGPNADRYLPKFKRFEEGGFAPAWHWPAFFAPLLWALYRKLWSWVPLIALSSLLWPLSGVIWALSADRLYFRRVRAALREGHAVDAKGATSPMAVWAALLFTLALGPLSLATYGDKLLVTLAERGDREVSGAQGAGGHGHTAARTRTVAQLHALALVARRLRAAGRDPAGLTLAPSWYGLDLEPVLRDAWGNRIALEPLGGADHLVSAGPDGTRATDDDIMLRLYPDVDSAGGRQ